MDSQATDQVTSVIQTDFNETVVKNINQNIQLNGLKGVAEGVGLDFYQQDVSLDGWLDTNGNQRAQVDLILASDIICQPEDAYAAARSIFSALSAGGRAIVVNGDSKHRFGVERFEDACTELGMTLSTTDVGDLYHGRLLSRDMEKTSGYVDGMTLNMHIIDKVNQ
jgi:predicted nicotinamide N-methyase